MMKTRVLYCALALTVFAMLAGTPPALACTCYCDSICGELGDCCPGCGPGGPVVALEATVTPLGQGVALVTLGGSLTTQMAAGSACLTAFSNFDGVAQINSIALVNAATGTPIYSFTPNELSAESVKALIAESGDSELAAQEWLGFHGVVPRDVPDGIVTQFALEVSLEPGANYYDLLRAVQSQVMVAGSADLEGSLDLHHVWLRSLADTPVSFQGRGGGTAAVLPNWLDR